MKAKKFTKEDEWRIKVEDSYHYGKLIGERDLLQRIVEQLLKIDLNPKIDTLGDDF
jgi:hypothetical protein